MGLIATWLSGIGLAHCIPSFKAAGIVSPKDLAELDLAHYEALGVSEPADRRKLFYLVQRIKMAVNEDENEQESHQQKVDAMLSQTLSSSSKLVLTEDDSLGEEEEETSRRMTSTARGRRRSSMTAVPPAEEAKENRRQNSKALRSKRRASVGSSSSSTTRPHNGRTAAASHNGRSTRASSRKQGADSEEEEEDSPQVDEESDWEREDASSISGEDDVPERSSAPAPRRMSRRLLEKRTQEDSDVESESDASHSRQETAAARPRTSGRNNASMGSSKRQSTSQVVTSGRRSTSVTSMDSGDDSSTSERARRKSSQLPTHRGARRYESKIQNPGASMRTGKQLSSIPSESVAPMSPLVSLPVSRLEADIVKQQEPLRKSAASRKPRSTSLGSGGSDSETSRNGRARKSTSGSDSDASSSSARRNSSARRSMDSARRQSSSSRRSFGGIDGRRGMPPKASSLRSLGTNDSATDMQRGRRSSLPAAGMRAKSENDKGAAAFVHGVAEDTSWGAQVDRLREENQAEHELFAGHCFQAVDEEMRIRVIIRKRPMSNSEASNSKEVDVIHPLEYDDYGRILVYQPKTRVDLTKEIEQVPFSFDNVFDENSSNKQIYDRSVRNLVPGVFEGKWASVFAYGQTGSGKTYTMLGSNLTGHNAGNATSDDDNLGLYYMAALDVFELANRPENQHLQVGASLFEIYGGKLFDLLNDRKPVKCLENHKGKVCFPGLSERPVSNADELMDVIETGAMNRSTGSTSKNADSSRSHAILQLSLRKDVGRQKNVEHGRLTFIDLAGSERGADTSQASRATRLEGAEINTSLLALKEVIRALATGDSMSHIPFRGSKLTQVLKESFVGKNSRSVMVACIAPNISNCEHTLNTLRYADRVKERNPETGNLSANVLAAASPKRTRRFSRSASVPAAFGETSAPSSIASYEAESESAHERSYDDSEALLNAELEGDDEAEVSYGDSDDLLDDLLRNTPHKVHATSTSNERNNSQPKSIESDKSSIKNGKDKRFETLVSTHRSVMTEMLGMVKQEMALVNKADSDRDTIDEYMAELDILHQKQLSMIQSVEESLLDYYESRGVSIGASEDHAADELGDLLSDDDSFDDLRD